MSKNHKKRRIREIIKVLKDNDIQKGISPKRLTNILNDLGPTYIKLGQILSMRDDILPKDYCAALQSLQTDATAMDYSEVIEIIDSELKEKSADLIDISKEPLGSASIAQAHKARLKNTGEEVVVKVQRPDIYETMEEDIRIMKRVARLMNQLSKVKQLDFIDFEEVIEELWKSAKQEMNFVQEANNAKKFRELNKSEKGIESPKIFDEYSTSKILTMNYIPGVDIDQIEILNEEGYSTDELSRRLCTNYIKQVLDDGYFHADPHPGNIRVNEENIAWIDLGMMGNLTEENKELFYQFVKGVAFNDSDMILEAFLKLGEHPENIDTYALAEKIEEMLDKYRTLDIDKIEIGPLMEEGLEIASKSKIKLPSDITLLGRGMITLEGVIRELSPNLNLLNIMSEYLEKNKKLDIKKEVKSALEELVISSKASAQIPVKLNEVLGIMKKGNSKLNITLNETEEILSAFTKMVNRLVMGIITAALLIGSSFIATTDMKPKILGIPALGFLGFIGSLALGVWIVYTMIVQDRTFDKK